MTAGPLSVIFRPVPGEGALLLGQHGELGSHKTVRKARPEKLLFQSKVNLNCQIPIMKTKLIGYVVCADGLDPWQCLFIQI